MLQWFISFPEITEILFYLRKTRGFAKVGHLGIDARIVLEQNKFSKKKATSDTTWTPDPRFVCGAHFFPSYLTPVLDPIVWKTDAFMILM